MPEYKGGFYRILLNTAEYTTMADGRISIIKYWYNWRSQRIGNRPDGWLRITEGREAAVKQVEQIILKGRGIQCQTENANDDTSWVNLEDGGTHTGEPSDSPEDLDYSECYLHPEHKTCPADCIDCDPLCDDD